MLKIIRGEFNKISFPSKKEVVKNTALVISAAAVASVLLSLINSGITELIHLLI